MKAETTENLQLPVWARADAFPEAPENWGWVDAKGKSHPCLSADALATAIREDPSGNITLVWTPQTRRMVLPEELDEMTEALRTARERWTREDLADATKKIRWFGTICIVFCFYTLFQGFVHVGQLAAQSGTSIDLPQRLKFSAQVVLASPLSGMALLMFMIFAFIPWYQARKRRGEMDTWDSKGIAAAVPAIRLETWLERQKAPFTKGFLVLLAAVAVTQLCFAGANPLTSLLHNWGGISEAGLLKDRYAQGEWWRLFTAPLLHGNIVHFLMNVSTLAYLGKRLEVFARWPHLPLVFLFAACVGGEASARFVAAPTVGASGGLMGWLGFLLVFETLHKSLVPRSARRRLAAGVLLIALIGVVGYRYIDNAAHAGGLLAGMLYAIIVFPKSSSATRPRSNATDYIAGGLSLATIIAAGVFAMVKMLGT